MSAFIGSAVKAGHAFELVVSLQADDVISICPSRSEHCRFDLLRHTDTIYVKD